MMIKRFSRMATSKASSQSHHFKFRNFLLASLAFVALMYLAGCGEDDPGNTAPLRGCADADATNYDADATEDDGSCTYPDLTISAWTVSDDEVLPDTEITLTASVKNEGTGSSPTVVLTYYQSSDATINSSDTEVGTDDVSGLNANGESGESITIAVPSTLGTYYYGACVPTVTGETSTDNNCSTGIAVTVSEPNLTISAWTVSVNEALPGTEITLTASVKNEGTGSSPAVVLTYYQSSDATINSSDTKVGTDDVSRLNANGESGESITIAVPSTPGTYYYGACVPTVPGETSTGNNCSQAVAVTVADDCADGTSTTCTTATDGTAVNGSIEVSGDTGDWFKVALTRGTTYNIVVDGPNTSSIDLDVLVYNSSGDRAASATSSGDKDFYFTPSSSGTHYIEVYRSSGASYPIGYTLSVRVDACADGTSTTCTTATDGTAVNGSIEASGDTGDWFKVALTRGTTYNIVVDGPNTSSIDLDVLVHNSSGTQVASATSSGDKDFYFTPSSSGTHYIEVYRSSGASYPIGYTLSVRVDACADGTSTTCTTATDGTAVNGSIEASGDTGDWFKVALTRGTTYNIVVDGPNTSSIDLDVLVHNSSGTQAASATSSGDKDFYFTPSSSGTHYIEVYRSSGASYPIGYTLSVRVDACADGTSTTCTTATDGTAVNGSIEASGDTGDWFKVALTRGTTYNIVVDGPNTSSIDLDVLVHNSSGTQAASATSSGDKDFYFTPSSSGTHYIEVYRSSGTSYPIGYTLSVRVDACADGTSTTCTTATDGTAVNGSIEASGDTGDWFKVALTRGTTYNIVVDGPNTSSIDLDVLVHNSSGTQVASATSSGDKDFYFTPSSSGTHYIEVYRSSGASYPIGYTLSVRVDACADGTSTTCTTATDGTAVNGSIEASGDTGDWFKVALTRGTTYNIVVDGPNTSSIDLDVLVHNSSGTQVASATSSGDKDFYFTPSSSGTHYIEVYRSSGASYPIGYTLSVRVDACADDASTTCTAATDGTAVNGSIEASGDTGDWFRVLLTGNTTYNIVMDGPSGTDLDVRVHNSSGTQVASGTRSGDEDFDFTPSSSGTHYIEVYRSSGASYPIGYTLTVTVADCRVTSNTITIPEGSSCTLSSSTVATYSLGNLGISAGSMATCSGGRIRLGSFNAVTLTLNGLTIRCGG